MVITSYRCHPFAVLRGGTITGVIGELLGRQAGMSNGKGGSMHIFTPRFFGGNGIVGAQVPLGAGIAFAMKYLERPSATFALYGDGASNQGQVFEAFNMAKLWDLPCVFVCENNKYGMGTSAERSSSNTEYFTRGDKIPGIQANGMDIIASAQAVKHARDWALSGKGPLLLEFVTYRYGGHSCVFSTYTRVQMLSARTECRILAQRIVRVRKCSVCVRRRTRSVACSAILKSGV
jgi:pyruvate dehydrogenase E1 component alpha subunit